MIVPTGFILAMTFLTRLPMPKVVNFQPSDMTKAVVWFPLAGMVVGGLVAGFWWLGNLVHPILAGLLGLLVWVWVTGALHLDGLSDLVDALGAAHANEERFFKVLEDPHVGSFGVVALVLQLLAKLILLTLLANVDMSAWWLVFVAAWARLGAAWWSLSLPSIKPGLGETFAWQGKVSQLGWGLGALTLTSLILSPLLLSALVPVILWRVWLKWRLGGQTGDALGAGIELSESVTLLLLVIIIQSLV
ncbi:MAG: adenosylcobinamide-GDP ribazoletransferase [Thiotrichales bacterium]|nr:MAG: adenosylcobinamide-GDP ribazoletransferase [Thiotrichales bacterium]